MMLRSALFIAGAAAFAPAPRIQPVLSLRADLEEAPPAPAPLDAPEQSGGGWARRGFLSLPGIQGSESRRPEAWYAFPRVFKDLKNCQFEGAAGV